jgi:hypothetical protein
MKPKIRKDGSIEVTIVVRLSPSEKEEAIDSLKRLDGLPPYDGGSNFCQGDGYFAQSIQQKFNLSLDVLAKASGYDQVKARWDSMRASFR